MKFDYKVIRSFETAFKEFEKSKDNNMEIYNVDSISETSILIVENFLLRSGAIVEIVRIGSELPSWAVVALNDSLSGYLIKENNKLKVKNRVVNLFKSLVKYNVYFYIPENKIVVEKK